jgi:hypothetical protein
MNSFKLLLVVTAASISLNSCAPYKIIKTDATIIESKKAIYTGTGFAYKKTNSRVWDTVKTPDVRFVARGPAIQFVTQEGKFVSGDVKEVDFDSNSVCMMAKMNALENYPFRNVYIGNWISGFLVGPVIGAIPAGIISSIPVTEQRAPILNTTMAADPAYKDCFMKQVNRTRRCNAWTGMIAGWSMAMTLACIIVPVTTSAK